VTRIAVIWRVSPYVSSRSRVHSDWIWYWDANCVPCKFMFENKV